MLRSPRSLASLPGSSTISRTSASRRGDGRVSASGSIAGRNPGLYPFSVPPFSVPSFSLPCFPFLNISHPSVSLPGFSLPGFSLPGFSLPGFSLPGFSQTTFSVPGAPIAPVTPRGPVAPVGPVGPGPCLPLLPPVPFRLWGPGVRLSPSYRWLRPHQPSLSDQSPRSRQASGPRPSRRDRPRDGARQSAVCPAARVYP
jgi:hypothetical protein